jgi:hypothetical protein
MERVDWEDLGFQEGEGEVKTPKAKQGHEYRDPKKVEQDAEKSQRP